MADEHMQIGEVASRTDLSLRTIRYYEEIGLVAPSGRTKGGFRLYTQEDVERLLLVKAIKPLQLSLDETRTMLTMRDALLDGREPTVPPARKAVEEFLADAEDRLDTLRKGLAEAEEAVRLLRRDLRKHVSSGG